MSEKHTYEEFLAIIKTLRSENGCPWDREQTHESLKPCMMEEAAEVVAAIRILDKTGDAENLREELGDVLLQVVMHAQIAAEEGLFNMEDVVNDVAEKMVRRHPHVFGTVTASNSEEVLRNWEDIKQVEKQDKSWIESPLKEIPMELPALTRASKVLKKASKCYGLESDYTTDLDRLEQAVRELRRIEPEAHDRGVEEQLGNILMAVSDMAGRYKISPEQILTDRIESFIDTCEEKRSK